MKNKINHYAEKCIEYVITHTVWYILTTFVSFCALNIPKLFSVLGKGTARLSNISNLLSVLSIIMFGVSMVAFVLALKATRKNSKKQVQRNNSDEGLKTQGEIREEVPVEDFRMAISDNGTEDGLATDIHFKKVTLSMKIASCTSIEYTMKYDGFATKANIEFFAKQLAWSGTDYGRTTLVSSNIEAHIEDNIGNRDHSPYTFRIVFDDDIAPGERIKFTTKTTLSDATKCMLPLSSFYVKYPIDELVLNVSAPIGLLHTMRKKCYRDAGRQIECFSSKSVEQQDVEGFRLYSFPQRNPTHWLYYALEWKFSENY